MKFFSESNHSFKSVFLYKNEFSGFPGGREHPQRWTIQHGQGRGQDTQGIAGQVSGGGACYRAVLQLLSPLQLPHCPGAVAVELGHLGRQPQCSVWALAKSKDGTALTPEVHPHI